MRLPFLGASSRPLLLAALLPPPRTSPRVLLSATPPPQRRSLATDGPTPSDDDNELWLGSVQPRALGEAQKKVVAYRQKYQCAGCDILLPPAYQVDHIKPLALGGHNGLSNLQALCVPCHARKTKEQRKLLLASGYARKELSAARAAAGNSAAGNQSRIWSVQKKSPPPSSAAAPAPTTSLDEIAVSSLSLLRGMNQQQLAAVVCMDGPMRVAAGPGTGKTRVLTARIAHLVREVNLASGGFGWLLIAPDCF